MAGGNKDQNSPRSSQGAPAGLFDIEGLAALVDKLEDAQKKGKKGAEELKNLNSRMEKLAKEAKKSKDPITVLTTSFSKMKGGSQGAADAITILTAEIEKSVEVMTSSSRATLEQNIEGIKKMQADLVASGKGESREAVMLNSKKSQLQMAAYKDEKNFMIERAKMMQTSGNPLKMLAGVGFGGFNAVAKNATVAAEALGAALGVTAGVMMFVSQVLIAITLPFMAFVLAAKKSATMMKNMAEAGETSASSLDEMRSKSRQFFFDTSAAAARANLTFKEMQELLVVMNKEMGGSAKLGADFAGSVANVGRTFGMANEESIRLAAKIAVSSRSQGQATLKAFTALGMHTAKLRLPLDALAEPMLALSELAGKTGHEVGSASKSLDLMIRSVESLKDSGVAVFKNMQPADIAKFTKEFSGFINGMDEWMLAAMTFNNSEDFQGMTERVAGMDANDRVRAIRDMMQENELFGAQHASELGMMLGAKTPSEALQRGKIAQAAVAGGISDTEYNNRMAKDIDAQLRSRKTAGEAIQFGVDPTSFMMDRVQKVLDTLIDIQNVILFWKGLNPFGKGTSVNPTSILPPASGSYGASTINSKRPNISVPIGPAR